MRWRETGRELYIVLGGDLAVAILLILFTHGVDSGYLLYSLTPVITAALLIEFRVAIAVAAVFVLTPFLAHSFFSQFMDEYEWFLDGNRLPVLILYGALGLLVPVVASRTNLNIHRFIAIDAVLDERRRMRREMHDGVAQSLNYLNLRAGAVSKALADRELDKVGAGIDEMRDVVRATYDDIRESLDQLTDEAVTNPLIPTLADYTQEFSKRHAIQVEFQAPDALRNLLPQGELQLLRIAQEALTNIRKHARASKALIKLQDVGSAVEMWVIDDGVGFGKSDGDSGDLIHHHGLTIMKERAESLGGTLEIRTGSENTTEIHVVVPR